MTNPSFDVLSEPWIPVVRSDGSLGECGLRNCMEQAHTLKEIRDPSPIVEYGLYRLMVAFLLDVLICHGQRPQDTFDLEELLQEGRVDPGMLTAYLEGCGDVFHLFHPARPFLQIAMDGSKSKPLAGIFPAMASGTNVGHWHHVPENDVAVSAPEAARLLATVAPFMTAGGAGLSPSINGSPAIYALPVGDNLFHTLVLNLPLRSDQDSGAGAVAWRDARVPGTERSQATATEALTWRPRCIQLLPEVGPDGRISVGRMRFEKGDSTRLSWIDAGLAYKYDKEKVTPIRMREHRPLWRDAGVLLLLNDLEHGRGEERVSFKRPDVVDHAFELAPPGSDVSVQVYGMRTDMKMKVFEWAKSVWRVPSNLGRSTRLGVLVYKELDLAEKAAYYLRTSIRALYPREGAGNKQALGTICSRCERLYWQRLESSLEGLLRTFAMLDPDAPNDPDLVAGASKGWREAIRSLAVDGFEDAAKDLDADANALERQVKARSRLVNGLRKVFE